MSTTGYFIGYLMMAGGVSLCLLGVDYREGGLATGGAILISSVWLGSFVLNRTSKGD